MAQGERLSPPFRHGQESGFGTLEQVPQNPSEPAGYQQIEEDSVERIPPRRSWLRRMQMPFLLLAGVAVPVALLMRKHRSRREA